MSVRPRWRSAGHGEGGARIVDGSAGTMGWPAEGEVGAISGGRARAGERAGREEGDGVVVDAREAGR